MYIGSSSLSSLHMFLCGYAFSRQEQDLPLTPEEKAFETFQDWVQQRFNINASVSWAKIILLHTPSEQAGLELFFDLWKEFITQQPDEAVNEHKKIVA
ncbi:MAG: hypothetical protein AAFQ63_16995 [Cyanobacteria bacterium J06621_11]